MNTRSLKFETLAFFSIGLFLFLIGIHNQEFIGFEVRFALFAKEMLQHGFSWFPTTYHQPYPDYPVTSTGLIYLLAKFFGEFNKLIAILPSAIAAAITLATTYAIAALENKRWGYFSVLMLLLTVAFFGQARTISLDQFPTTITVVCFYCVYSADHFKKFRRLWLVPLFLLIGFAFRGPIGLIIPTSVIGVYYLLQQNYKRLVWVGLIASSLLVLCSALLVLISYQAGNVDFTNQVLHMEVLSRIHKVGNYPPFYYYLSNGIPAFAPTLPLALLVIYGLKTEFITKNPNQQIQLLQKLAGWVFIILLGMSFAADKKIRYVLAISPALAIIAAYIFIAPKNTVYLRRLYKSFYYFLLATPSILLFTFLITPYFAKQQQVTTVCNFWFMAGLFSSLILVNYFLTRQKSPIKDLAITVVATLSVILIFIFCVEPVTLSVNKSRDFVKSLEMERQQKQAQLVFYQEDRDGLPLKYLINAPGDPTPLFVSNPNDLLKIKAPSFIILGEEEFSQIPRSISHKYQIVTRNVLGRKNVLVITQQVS